MKIFFRLVTFVFIIISLQSVFASNAEKLGWRTTVLLGDGQARATQTQKLDLTDTPLPGLDNQYIGGGKLYGASLAGLGFEKFTDTKFNNILAATGVEIDYLRDDGVNGYIKPMVNISPNFDQLKYSYDIHSVLLQATGKVIKLDLIDKVGGYAQAGLGLAINRLSDYREYPPKGSSAAPMLSPFGNRDTLNLGLSVGVGVTYKLAQYDDRISLGYRFAYTGRGSLMKSGVQQTSDSMTLSPITYHFIMLTWTV